MGKQSLCVLAHLLVSGLASAASFTPLGFLNGVNNSHASGVSADGSVVVGSSFSAQGPQALRWTGGVVAGLGVLPGDTASAANGVSADGAVVVGASIDYDLGDPFYEAFQLTAMTGLGGFPEVPPFCNSQAFGVSADGAVVVGECSREAFRWTGGVMTGLGVLPGDIESVANGVSADGAVVVGRSDGKAFRWTSGVMTELGVLPGGTYTEAFGVSTDGTTVVGSSHNGTGYEAFQWFGGVMTGLGVLPGDTDSVAYGASDTGLVVGRSYAIVQGELRDQAFVWTPWDDMARLEDVLVANGATGLAGWTLTEARGISADGQWIVGTGINPNGNPQAFLANVSTGSPSVAVPNVVGQTQAAATTAITIAGFVLGTVTRQASSTVASGYVISESPVAGAVAASGSKINLVVSMGGSGGGGGGGGALDGFTLSGLLGALAIGMRRRRGIEKIKFVALLQDRLSACTSSKLHAVSMTLLSVVLFSSLTALLGWSAPASADPLGGASGCLVNMVQVGPLCVDQYEASVWSEFPASDGRPRGTQFGRTGDDYPCSVNGNDCSGVNPIFAVSAPDTTPSASITWFQAQQACLNAAKRLPTNAEWQGAAAGTPTDYEPYADDGVHDCNASTAKQVVPTGSRRNCVSRFGVFDMVGNLLEYTADWIQGNTVPFALSVGTAGPDFGDDFMRGISPAIAQGFGTNFPGVLVRGGGWRAGYYSPNGSGAGVFALNVRFSPADAGDDRGFRCVR